MKIKDLVNIIEKSGDKLVILYVKILKLEPVEVKGKVEYLYKENRKYFELFKRFLSIDHIGYIQISENSYGWDSDKNFFIELNDEKNNLKNLKKESISNNEINVFLRVGDEKFQNSEVCFSDDIDFECDRDIVKIKAIIIEKPFY